MDIKIYQQISDKFDTLRFFAAKNRVDSMAMWDRKLCDRGDSIEVIKWMCSKGPTTIKVNGKETCIPFGWVKEMGAPEELEMYMPFPEKTWAEIIEEKTRQEQTI